MSLVHWYDMSVPVGMPDLGIPGGNPAVGANIASNPPGMPGGNCAEFNGNNSNYNLGSIAELSEVSQFTIAFWMNQNILDVRDDIFYYVSAATYLIQIYTEALGNMYFIVANGAAEFVLFDYSTVINAGQWHHVVYAFDGSQAVDANKHAVYVDGLPVVLTLGGTHPTLTADLSGATAYIGRVAVSLDGKLDTFMIFNGVLTNLQATDLWNRTRQGTL